MPRYQVSSGQFRFTIDAPDPTEAGIRAVERAVADGVSGHLERVTEVVEVLGGPAYFETKQLARLSASEPPGVHGG